MSDPLVNPKDPLRLAGPQAQEHLYREFKKISANFSIHDIVGASAMLLVEAVRQGTTKRTDAERGFDDIFGQAKQWLMNCFDVTGRRKNIFPHNQTIEGSLVKFDNKFPTHPV